MIRIVIINENVDILTELFNKIGSTNRYKIQGIYGDFFSAKNYIVSENVDVVLLNIKSFDSKVIELLSDIKDKNASLQTILLVEDSECLVNLINSNIGASEILVAPFSADNVLERLDKICNLGPIRLSKLSNKFSDLLSEFAFNKSNLGYSYIIECLICCVEERQRYISEIQDVYDKVCIKNPNISRKKLPWNISKAIASMNKLTSEEVMEKYFPYNKYPSTKTFINEILDMFYRSIEKHKDDE